MEPKTLRKKRPRQTDSCNDEGDRRRGRPRVEKDDESAADRRRTQIRMAQRAYRQRKESTLDELRRRVSELSNTVELMNKAFGECRDRLYATNITQDQMRDIGEVAQRFEDLVKDARNPVEEVVYTPRPHPAKAADDALAVISAIETRLDIVDEPMMNVPSWLDQSAVQQSAKLQNTNTFGIGLGYHLYPSQIQDNSQKDDQHPTFDVQLDRRVPSQASETIAKPDLFDAVDVNMSQDFSILGLQMNPPRTYSFQESTFARRIFRAAIEGAHELLLDPRRKPSELERVFRLSLMGRDRTKILASLRAVLARGPHEELDFWQAPLIHIGGAGTHYARRDPFGNLQPKRVSNNIGIIGPQALALLENAARENVSVDTTVEIAGFEGEWFDPYDVQGYLEEKGIFIEPSASFAHAEIVEWSPTPSSVSTGSWSGRPRTPAKDLVRSTPFTAGQVARLDEVEADLTQWNDFTNMQLGAVGFSDASKGSWMNFLQPGESIRELNDGAPLFEPLRLEDFAAESLQSQSDSAPLTVNSSHPPRKKTIIIDVAKFVEVLIVSGVCLGRSPGFRRRDVERALAISSFDAF